MLYSPSETSGFPPCASVAPPLQHYQLRQPSTAALPAGATALLQRSTCFENKNLAFSATFFRLGAAAISLNADIGSKKQQIYCWKVFFVFCGWARIANRKKVAEKARFLFLRFRNGAIGLNVMKQRRQLARGGGNTGDRFRYSSHCFLMKLRNICHISQHGNFHWT